PRDQRRVLGEQRSQPSVVPVVNRGARLRDGPLPRAAQASLHFGGPVPPAGKSVFARDDELRVAVRQRQPRVRQLRVDASDGGGISGGRIARESLGLFAEGVERRTGGEIPGSGHGASFHEPPAPAETSG